MSLIAVAENEPHHAGEQRIAEPVAAPVALFRLADPDARHHVEPFLQRQPHHLGGAGGVVGVVAVDQDIEVGLDVGEHASDHMALALQPLAAHDRAGRAGGFHRAVAGVVVVDIDGRLRQGCAEIGDDFRNRRLPRCSRARGRRCADGTKA